MKKTLATAVVLLSFLSIAGTAHASDGEGTTTDTGTETQAGTARVWMWDCNGDGNADHISGGGIMHLVYSVANCTLLRVIN